jgi:hypothetical protein
VYREVKRTVMNDYDLARENFVNMGEMMMRLIYQVRFPFIEKILQMNIGWQEFLGFYTGLNVVRKKHDETFIEQKGIGEEIEDPNNSGDEEAGQEEKK